MRAASMRRRSATAAVSTGRPMPGNSGTGVHAPIGWTGTGGGDGADGGSGAWERACAPATAVNVTATTMNAEGPLGSGATARDATRQLGRSAEHTAELH